MQGVKKRTGQDKSTSIKKVMFGRRAKKTKKRKTEHTV